MNIRRINPNIGSDQIEKSKEFYSDFLGMKLVMDMKSLGIITFASVSNPTAQVNILKKDETLNSNPAITLTIEVSDIDTLYSKANSLGYKILYPITNETFSVRRFAVLDPNGIIINLMCHLKSNE